MNINTDGKICHEILGNAWNSHVTMREVLENIATLLIYPNPLNALDSVKGSMFMDNKEEYYHTARRYTEEKMVSVFDLRAMYHITDQ